MSAYPSAVLSCLIKQYLSDCCAKACLIGYEPADLTVHPPPQNNRGWVHFFCIGV